MTRIGKKERMDLSRRMPGTLARCLTALSLAVCVVLAQGACVDAWAGTMRAWGNNMNGELGDGTGINSPLPVQVIDPTDPSGFLNGVADIADLHNSSLAIMADGTMRAWGRNQFGQLGDNTLSNSDVPVQVLGVGGSGFFTGAVEAAGGDYHSVALKSDGTVYAWGSNDRGQLGVGSAVDSSTPVQVLDPADPTGFLTGVVSVAAGYDHSVALKQNGTVRTWGRNQQGELGNGTNIDSPTVVQVIDPIDPSGFLTGVVAIATGGDHCMALKANGTVWAWGGNHAGQLGDGTTVDSYTPVKVVDSEDKSGFLKNVAFIASGYDHSLAVKSDGTVWSWGLNYNGRLGDGTEVNRPVPGRVLDPGDPTGYLGGVIEVSGGCAHSAALKSDGTMMAWGSNAQGQLGDNTSVNRSFAVRVVDPSDPTGYLTGISNLSHRGSGGHHTLARVSPVRVSSVNLAIVPAQSRVRAAATILVVDQYGAPAPGVTVGGHWEGLTTDADIGITGPGGDVTLTSDALRSPVGTFTFVIDTMKKDGYIFDPYMSVLSNSIQYP